MKNYFLVFFFFPLISCVNIQGINELEKGLNTTVGQPYENFARGRRDYLSLIDKTTEYEEYEFKRPDGCAYAFKVNPKTRIVMSWRFSSSREACDKDMGLS